MKKENHFSTMNITMPGGFRIHERFKLKLLMTRRRGTAIHAVSRAFPFPVILLKKARWGRGGGQGEGGKLSNES